MAIIGQTNDVLRTLRRLFPMLAINTAADRPFQANRDKQLHRKFAYHMR